MNTASTPICPYCGNPAKLTDSTVIYGRHYGMVWDCRPCDAYVGVHSGSRDHAPLGTLADKALRTCRKEAHAAFDPLWKGSAATMARNDAYGLLCDWLDIVDPKFAHIAHLNEEQCALLVQQCSRYRAGQPPMQRPRPDHKQPAGLGSKLRAAAMARRAATA